MCGIVGAFWRNPSPDADARLRAGLDSIAHRGPDGRGDETFQRVDGLLKIGHTRLSIIDLSDSGRQPMKSRDGRFTLSFNGEIYNYKELRQELLGKGFHFVSESDTEVLLAAWEAWGEGCLSRLVGMFAFVVYDHDEGTLSFARDAFGIKPLFYFHDPSAGSLLFASEVGAILGLLNRRPEVNWQRAYDYIVHGLQDGNKGTFIEGVEHLPPAHFMRFDLAACKVTAKRPWWIPRFEQTNRLSFEDAAEVLRNLFLENVRLHLRSDVPVGAALSGGIDSSAVVCAMRLLEPDMPIHTFSYIAKGTAFSEESWVDLVNGHVKAIPHKIHVAPLELAQDFSDLIRTQGEPFNSTSMYAQYRVFKEARACRIPVVLEGQGADELMAGYEGYPGQRMKSLLERGQFGRMFGFARSWRKHPGRRHKSPWRSLIGQMLPEAMHARALRRGGTGMAAKCLDYPALMERGVVTQTPWMGRTKAGRGRRVAEALAFSLSEHELPTLLRFGDRNAMRFSIENRVPFLTVGLADFMLSLPESYLISDSGETKSIFRAAMKGIVPDAILQRQDKIGFVTPMQDWIASDGSSLRRIFAQGGSHAILKKERFQAALERVLSYRGDLTPDLWRYINFTQWSKEFDVDLA